MVRLCLDCKVILRKENTYPSLMRSQSYICKACSNVRTKKWAIDNPGRIRTYDRRSKLKYKYGLTVDEYNAMLASQNGLCALCEKEHKRRPLNVDHCHETKKIRGLLCDKCNLAIGLLNDDHKLVEKIVGYLS